MSSFEGLLGVGSAARQLLIYGVGYEVARSLLGPMFTQIEYDINANSPIVELTPPQIADLVVRGVIANEPDAAARAKVYGLDAGKFEEMVRLAGEPPGLVQVLEWWRRGILPWDQGVGAASVAEAIRTSRIYTYWTDTIKNAQFAPPGAADALDGVLRNVISEAEGLAIAYYAGLGYQSADLPADTDVTQTANAFGWMLEARGNPPSLGELLDLARRGIIPWGNLDPATKVPNAAEISFAQGIFEGDNKDKWLPYYARLAEYLPPPRTITTLLRTGAITVAEATQLFEDAGLTPALADAYIASASSAKTTATKNLNEAAVEQLYLDKLIDQPTALQLLEALGYNPTEAAYLIESAGLRQTIADLNKNIGRVGSYFISRHIDEATARTLLANLGLPGAQIDQLIAGWTIDRTANVKRLTPAQIASAWDYGVLTQDQAQASLEADGYTPYDAWVILSDKAKQPLPNPPPQGPPPVT